LTVEAILPASVVHRNDALTLVTPIKEKRPAHPAAARQRAGLLKLWLVYAGCLGPAGGSRIEKGAVQLRTADRFADGVSRTIFLGACQDTQP